MKKTKHSQTKESFNQKWQNNQDLLVANTLDENSEFFKWIINRNGFISSKELLSFLKNKKRILDAGCGNGRITAMLHKYSPSSSEIVAFDIIESVFFALKLIQTNCSPLIVLRQASSSSN